MQGMHEVPLEWISRCPYQSRTLFAQDALQELADSIQVHGVIQPVVLRQVEHQRYELIAGERRWRAAQLAGLDAIPAIVRQIPDEQACQLNTIENIQRVDLNAIEEAMAYQRLIDDFKYTHEEVGQAVSKSRAKISNLLRLLTLPLAIQQSIADQTLNESQGKLLVGLTSHQQSQLFHQCISRSWSQRQLESAIRAIKQTKAPGSIDKDPDIIRMERQLSSQIGCETKIDFGHGSGVMHIHFHDIEVLEGILVKLGYHDCIT